MTIPGIGAQSTSLITPRNNEGADRQLRNENQTSIVATRGTETSETKNTTLPAVPTSTKTNKTTTSRQDLVELETARNRFKLQQDLSNAKGESAKALQSFIDVEQFEQKDELNTLVGIDLFV